MNPPTKPTETHRVLVLGSNQSGKTTLIESFSNQLQEERDLMLQRQQQQQQEGQQQRGRQQHLQLQQLHPQLDLSFPGGTVMRKRSKSGGRYSLRDINGRGGTNHKREPFSSYSSFRKENEFLNNTWNTAEYKSSKSLFLRSGRGGGGGLDRRGSSSSSTSSSSNNSESVTLTFREVVSLEDCLPRSPMSVYRPDAYLVVYSVSDRESFDFVRDTLLPQIQKWDDIQVKPVIVVANKTDLVRTRCVSKQEGRQIAINHNCKYIETSCTISLNVDFLLAGIGAQIKLKSSFREDSRKESIRKPNIIRRILNRAALLKSRSCDNLTVL